MKNIIGRKSPANGKWYGRIKDAGNNRVVGDLSQGYASKPGLTRAIHKNFGDGYSFMLLEESKTHFTWRMIPRGA